MDKSNLYKVEQELEKLIQQEKRLLDAYRESIIELDELREQKSKIAKRLHVAKAKHKAIQSAQEAPGTPNITLSELLDLSAIYKRAMSKADPSTKQTIANLLINRVKLFPTKAVVEGIIPLDNYALIPAKHASPLRADNVDFNTKGKGGLKSSSLGAIIGSYKSAVTRAVNKTGNRTTIWQRNYYDRVIRDERELEAARSYVANNYLKKY